MGLFEPEDLLMLREVFKDSPFLKLVEHVEPDSEWPAGVDVTFKAKGKKGDIKRWSSCLNYRDHVGRLLLALALERKKGVAPR